MRLTRGGQETNGLQRWVFLGLGGGLRAIDFGYRTDSFTFWNRIRSYSRLIRSGPREFSERTKLIRDNKNTLPNKTNMSYPC